MVTTRKFKTLEEGLLLLEDAAKQQNLSIAEILKLLAGKGRPLILLLLSLPFCQPLQIPGLSLPFGIAIAFTGLRMILAKKLWIPSKLLEKKIPGKTLEKMSHKMLTLVTKIKSWIHPRLYFLCHSSFMEKSNGILIFILGVFLALPLPIPLSNLTAAWSIFLLALGILEDDGLFVLIGYLTSLLTIAFFLVVILTIKEIV